MATPTDNEIAEVLAAILRPFADRLHVVNDSAAGYYTQTKKPYPKRGPLM